MYENIIFELGSHFSNVRKYHFRVGQPLFRCTKIQLFSWAASFQMYENIIFELGSQFSNVQKHHFLVGQPTSNVRKYTFLVG